MHKQYTYRICHDIIPYTEIYIYYVYIHIQSAQAFLGRPWDPGSLRTFGFRLLSFYEEKPTLVEARLSAARGII